MIGSGDYREIVSALWLCPQSTALSLGSTTVRWTLWPSMGCCLLQGERMLSFAQGSALPSLEYGAYTARLGRWVLSEPWELRNKGCL